MSNTTDQEEFREVMKIVGIDSATVDMIQAGTSFNALHKYNRREYDVPLKLLKEKLNLSRPEMQLLELFRDFYTDLAPRKRTNVLSHFDSGVWNDYKQATNDNKLHEFRRFLKFNTVASALMLFVFIPFVVLEWRSLGMAQAQLNFACGSSSRRIAVNCYRVQCDCCYQREKDRSGEWMPTGRKC